jgi:hypothetical protein
MALGKQFRDRCLVGAAAFGWGESKAIDLNNSLQKAYALHVAAASRKKTFCTSPFLKAVGSHNGAAFDPSAL